MKRLIILLFAALLLRLAFLPFFEGNFHDGTHRTLVAWSWLQDPYMIFGRTAWPFLNYLFPAFAMCVTGELFWSTRILYLLISVSNILALYLLTREALDERSAWMSAVLITINPYHIRCSLDGAISETPYISLVILALYFAFRYRRAARWRYLAGCGVAVNLATMFRFDAVLWGVISGYILLVPEGKVFPRLFNLRLLRAVFALGAICAIFPLLVSMRWYQLYGDMFYVFHTAKLATGQFFDAGRHVRFSPMVYQAFTLVFWPASAFLILTPLVATASMFGMLGRLFHRESAELAFGYLFFSLWLMFSAYHHTIQCQFRYSLILQLLLSAFFLIGIKQFLRLFHWQSLRSIYTICGVIGVITYAVIVGATFADAGVFTRQFSAISPVNTHPYATRGLLKWIRSNTRPDEKVLILPGVESPYFALKVHDPVVAGRVAQMSIFKDNVRIYSIEEFKEAFKKRLEGFAYVVINQKSELGLRDGMLRGILSIPPDSSEVFTQFGFRYLPAVNFGNIRVYRIELIEKVSPG